MRTHRLTAHALTPTPTPAPRPHSQASLVGALRLASDSLKPAPGALCGGLGPLLGAHAARARGWNTSAVSRGGLRRGLAGPGPSSVWSLFLHARVAHLTRRQPPGGLRLLRGAARGVGPVSHLTLKLGTRAQPQQPTVSLSHMGTHGHTCTRTHAHTHTRTHAHTHTHTHAHALHAYSHPRAHVYTHIHTYAHTYARTHSLTPTPRGALSVSCSVSLPVTLVKPVCPCHTRSLANRPRHGRVQAQA